MQRLTSAREVVHVLGGIPGVCKMTGASSKAVYRWARVTGFPARTYDLMKTALEKKAYSAPAALWNQQKAKNTSNNARGQRHVER